MRYTWFLRVTSQAAAILVLFYAVCFPIVARAEATLQKQSVVQQDICAGDDPANMSAEDAASCAQDAMWNENWTAFFKWGPVAAKKGDWVAASWVGDEFRYRYNYFYAYMWFDIAAQLHAAEITSGSPATNPTFREDNSSQLVNRDEMGKSLTTQQRAQALAQEKNWLPPKN